MPNRTAISIFLSVNPVLLRVVNVVMYIFAMTLHRVDMNKIVGFKVVLEY